MINPHIHVPYHRIGEYLHFIHANRINLEVYFASHTLDRLKSFDILNLNRELDYGPLFSIHAPFMDLSPGAIDPKIRAVTFERFSQVFDIAEILKPRSIVFHSGYEKWKYSLKFDVWLEQSLKTWKSLTKRAADSNLKIAIENVFEDEPTNLRLLMEEMGSHHFGICFDTGHFNLFSKMPVNAWLDQLSPYIVEIHLHDNFGKADDHIAIGEGTFDFDMLFSIVKDSELIYTIEGHSPEDVLKSIERLKGYF
jgi:sugar phosphate isomerase/epimerase